MPQLPRYCPVVKSGPPTTVSGAKVSVSVPVLVDRRVIRAKGPVEASSEVGGTGVGVGYGGIIWLPVGFIHWMTASVEGAY